MLAEDFYKEGAARFQRSGLLHLLFCLFYLNYPDNKPLAYREMAQSIACNTKFDVIYLAYMVRSAFSYPPLASIARKNPPPPVSLVRSTNALPTRSSSLAAPPTCSRTLVQHLFSFLALAHVRPCNSSSLLRI